MNAAMRLIAQGACSIDISQHVERGCRERFRIVRKTVPRAADAPAARSLTGSADPRSDADGSERAPESFTTAGTDDRGAEESSRRTGSRSGVRKKRRPKVAGSRSAGPTSGSSPPVSLQRPRKQTAEVLRKPTSPPSATPRPPASRPLRARRGQ